MQYNSIYCIRCYFCAEAVMVLHLDQLANLKGQFGL